MPNTYLSILANYYELFLFFLFLQELDEKRIKNVRNYMLKSVEIERAVSPIIATCLDGIENAANEINEKEDSLMVIERYKSGFTPPGDFPFEDLSTVKMSLDTGDNRLPQPIMQPIHNHLTVKGTVSGGKMKKRVGLFGIFSSNKVRYCFFFSSFYSYINTFEKEKLKNFYGAVKNETTECSNKTNKFELN